MTLHRRQRQCRTKNSAPLSEVNWTQHVTRSVTKATRGEARQGGTQRRLSVMRKWPQHRSQIQQSPGNQAAKQPDNPATKSPAKPPQASHQSHHPACAWWYPSRGVVATCVTKIIHTGPPRASFQNKTFRSQQRILELPARPKLELRSRDSRRGGSSVILEVGSLDCRAGFF